MHVPNPNFQSMAFDLERIDYADCILLAVPPGSTATATDWAEEMFSTRAMPRWIALAMGLRQRLVRLIGLKPSPPDAFRVRAAAGEEVLLEMKEQHLHCRIAVGLDSTNHLVRVTTAVQLHGLRGRAYFLPVRLAHPVVVASMLRATQRRMK